MSSAARFETLYDEEYDAVYAFCARRVGLAAAADATAEVFTVAWRRRDDIPTGAGRAWLFGVARNTVLNAWRTERRRSRLNRRVRSVRNPQPIGPDLVAVRSDEARAVHEALDTLRASDRELLIMSAWDDLTASEIAQILGISPTATHQRLHRAKQRLGKALAPRSSQPTADRPAQGGAE